jgi:hypothetical protein
VKARWWGVAMLAAAALCGERAHAQARGPSAMDVLANGQDVGTARQGLATRRVSGWRDIPIGEPAPDPEFAALGAPGELDPEARAAQLRQLDAWLRKLAGRYRIDGTVETPGHVTVQVVGASNAMEDLSVASVLSGKVHGLADCADVGEGPGIHCVISATWNPIDIDVAKVGDRPTISEALKTFSPAMLDIGLNRDPPGIRALLVTDDSISHMWAGKVDGDTLIADRLNDCKTPTLNQPDDDPPDPRCLQPLQITTGPGDAATIILRTPLPELPPWAEITDPKPRLTITFAMHRDDEVTAESLRKEADEAKKAGSPRQRKRR